MNMLMATQPDCYLKREPATRSAAQPEYQVGSDEEVTLLPVAFLGDPEPLSDEGHKNER